MPIVSAAPFTPASSDGGPSAADVRDVFNDVRNLPRYRVLLTLLGKKRDAAVRAALYAAEPEVRAVNAGRAQAWLELLDLLEGK